MFALDLFGRFCVMLEILGAFCLIVFHNNPVHDGLLIIAKSSTNQSNVSLTKKGLNCGVWRSGRRSRLFAVFDGSTVGLLII